MTDDRKISQADVLRILDEYAKVLWNNQRFLAACDYAKAIKEIEKL